MPYCNGPFPFLSPSFPDLSPCFQSALHVLITLSTILTVLGSSLSLLGCVNRSHSGSTCISIADPAFVSGSNDSETEREHGHGHNGTMEVFRHWECCFFVCLFVFRCILHCNRCYY